jgi:tetratricopeptide (TPR) repeat protein
MHKSKRQFLFLLSCISVLWSNYLIAGTITYEKANQYYHNQQYAEALDLYNQMINEKVVNASVYYNAGNTHYKLGKMGMAIWCYQKALQLDPTNVLIAENLQLTQQKVPTKASTGNAFVPIAMLKKVLYFHSANRWAVGAIALFFVAMAIYVFRKIYKMPPIFIALQRLSWYAFGIYLIATISRQVFDKTCKYAIIIENAILYNNPKEQGLQQPEQTEGLQVQVISFAKGGVMNASKYKIRLQSGREAWVDESVIKVL